MLCLEVSAIPLPEDGPAVADISRWASRMGLTIEVFLGRALCEYVERLEEEDRDPGFTALFRPAPPVLTREPTEYLHDLPGRADPDPDQG